MDVIEIKLKEELQSIKKGKTTTIENNEFEELNRKNFDFLEKSLHSAHILNPDEFILFYNLVRYFKTCPNMKNERDLKNLLEKIQNKSIRSIFPIVDSNKDCTEKSENSF